MDEETVRKIVREELDRAKLILPFAPPALDMFECPICKIKWAGPMAYVCLRSDCPTKSWSCS